MSTRRDWAAWLGIMLLGAALLLCLLGLFIDQDATTIALERRLQPPNFEHWFGTDELGRDLLGRVAQGSWRTLGAAFGVVSAAFGLGILIGAASALAPGWADFLVMRGTEIVLSIPALVLAMALAAALGPGLTNAMIALTIALIPGFVRLARNQAIVVRTLGFVEAARLNGASPWRILWDHVAPNIFGPLLVQAVSSVSGVILAAAALGFIGLGAQPPTPEWGALAASGRIFFLEAWWYAVFPGAAVAGTCAGLTLLGDALRARMDEGRA